MKTRFARKMKFTVYQLRCCNGQCGIPTVDFNNAYKGRKWPVYRSNLKKKKVKIPSLFLKWYVLNPVFFFCATLKIERFVVTSMNVNKFTTKEIIFGLKDSI